MKENQTKNEYFDVVVIGGGAAGMMATLSACASGAKVALIEKNKTLGKKLLMTGNGRCNLTQKLFEPKDFIEKIGKDGRFLFSSLSAFGPVETMAFFEKLGVKLKTEKNGRVFPKSNKAHDILNALQKELEKNNVKILTGLKVNGIKTINGKIDCVETSFHASTRETKIFAKNFIIATGGKSYPGTGSSGDGYDWLKNLGHKINLPMPALSPIKIKEAWIRDLKGLSLQNIPMAVIQNGKKTSLGPGEMIFTHFGLSGPAVINASKLIGQKLQNGEAFLELDLLPFSDLASLQEKMKKDFVISKDKNLKTYLSEIFPERLSKILMGIIGIEEARKLHSVTKIERIGLCHLIKKFRLTVYSLLGFEGAMVTSGGADTKDVDPKTMRSRIVSNLFLAGEILDLDGPTGGYNLQIAWTTGSAAGKAAGKIDR